MSGRLVVELHVIGDPAGELVGVPHPRRAPVEEVQKPIGERARLVPVRLIARISPTQRNAVQCRRRLLRRTATSARPSW
jgi:hypothetical protein